MVRTTIGLAGGKGVNKDGLWIELCRRSISVFTAQMREEFIERYDVCNSRQSSRLSAFMAGGNFSRLPFPAYPPCKYHLARSTTVGACRFGIAWFVISLTQRQQILQAAYGTDGTPLFMPLVMQADDITHPDNSGGITTQMRVLEMRVLAQTGGSLDGFYLLTLVDERFDGWRQSAGEIQCPELASWSTLIDTLTTALGIDLSVPTISSVFGTPEPDSDLWTNEAPAGFLLDAVAGISGWLWSATSMAHTR